MTIEFKTIGQTRIIGSTRLNTVQFYKKKGSRITADEVKRTLAKLEEKSKGKNIQFLIKGLNGDRMKTLKGWNSELDIKDFDDYYEGLDEETANFDEFYQIQITSKQYI